MSEMIRVAVCGASGRMGRAVVRAVSETDDMSVVAAIDLHDQGMDAGILAGLQSIGVPVEDDLEMALKHSRPDAVVDFSVTEAILLNARASLSSGAAAVIGATGLREEDLAELSRLSKELGVPVFIAPNFAIGAVLLMQFAAQAARYMPDAEIIEMHHPGKRDAPSGTALRTAEIIAAARESAGVHPVTAPPGAFEILAGARGGRGDHEIPCHSVRLPGLVAHQEVIFGAEGQTLTLRHDSIDRTSFMPGVLLALRKVKGLSGLTIGLENLL